MYTVRRWLVGGIFMFERWCGFDTAIYLGSALLRCACRASSPEPLGLFQTDGTFVRTYFYLSSVVAAA